jgi:hypothetical protein
MFLLDVPGSNSKIKNDDKMTIDIEGYDPVLIITPTINGLLNMDIMDAFPT